MKLLIMTIAVLFIQAEAYRGKYKDYWKRKPVCAPVKCEEHCKEVADPKDPKGCPTCVCEEPKCSPPVCLKPCKLKEIPDKPCPVCECDDEDYKAGEDEDNDYEDDEDKIIPGIDLRRPMCSPPKCPPGCVIEKEFKGPCPGCKCGEEEEEKDEIPEIKEIAKLKKCAPVKCDPKCKKPIGPDGCPVCMCEEEVFEDIGKPVCLPPKCPPRCKLQEKFDGPCPGCDCFEVEEEKKFEKPKRKPACLPPKCPPGCKVERFFEGPCPGCDCKKEERKIVKKCDIENCLPGCKKVLDDVSGCPYCDCKPVCSIPKCGFGCELDKEPKGPCPGCICKESFKEVVKDELKEEKGKKKLSKCPPYEHPCYGPDCKVIEDEEGCKICKCEPKCAIPKCPWRCSVKQTEGKCPECVCPKWKYGYKG